MSPKRCAYCRTACTLDFHIGRFVCEPCQDRQAQARAWKQRHKYCYGCRKYQPIKAFAFLEDRDARDTLCKACRAHHSERLHGKRLYAHHKMTRDTYEKLLVQQESRCAICRIPVSALQDAQSRHNRLLHVDHNHRTGQVRGLLCHRCNHGLGSFQDNAAFLLSAIQYLTRAEERYALPKPTPQPVLQPLPNPQPKPTRVPDYSKVAKSLRLLKQRQQESVALQGEQDM
jgi:Recombination endonuclease VII